MEMTFDYELLYSFARTVTMHVKKSSKPKWLTIT